MFRLLTICLCLIAPTVHATDRTVAWTQELAVAGLPNLHQVTPNLYRCAQPTAAGLRAAETLGIKTVISLRAFHTDKDQAKSTNLRLERIRFNTWNVEEEDIVRFLKIVTDTNAGPILLHCQHGADRTGLMIAIYRMTVQNWTKEAAIREMRDGGYGYHRIWRNLMRYLNGLDIESLKAKAGIAERR